MVLAELVADRGEHRVAEWPHDVKRRAATLVALP
jgi:hypothetical protein